MIKKYTTIKVHLRHPSKCWRLSFFCGKVMCWTNQAFHSCGNSVWRIQVANDLVAYKDHKGPTPYSFNIHKYKYDMQKRKQRICRQHAWHADESGFHWRKQKMSNKTTRFWWKNPNTFSINSTPLSDPEPGAWCLSMCGWLESYQAQTEGWWNTQSGTQHHDSWHPSFCSTSIPIKQWLGHITRGQTLLGLNIWIYVNGSICLIYSIFELYMFSL